jgi:hypothetical protein
MISIGSGFPEDRNHDWFPTISKYFLQYVQIEYSVGWQWGGKINVNYTA